MNLAMWVLAFLVTGWEGKGDGIDIKAYWTQDSCEQALAMVRDKPLIYEGTRYLRPPRHGDCEGVEKSGE